MTVATSSVPEEWWRLGVRGHREQDRDGTGGWGWGCLGQDRELVAGCKVWGSRRDRKGRREAGFSEVKPAVGTESSEEVPEAYQSRKWGGFKRETWRNSQA